MGHRSLLKTVLIKSTETMAVRGSQSKCLATYVCALADQYCRVNHNFNEIGMNAFLAVLRDVAGDGSGSVSVSVSVDSAETDVRSYLERTIPLLLSVLQCERPASFISLSAINWRLLFDMPPDPPVKVVLTPGTDDESGGGSLGDSSSPI